jgi:predicted MFS family arabinose efflux permease
VVAGLGSGWALAMDAATFAVAAACFALVQVPDVPATARRGLLGEVRDGLAEVLRHTWLWLLIGQALLYHLFFGGAHGVLGPIVVGDTLGRPAWGFALSTTMVGFVVGGLVTLRWKPRRALFVGTCFLALTACFPAAMAFADSLPIVLAGAFLYGFGLEIFSVGWDLSIQENVAPDKLSRVYAFDMIGSYLARPAGLALTGPVATLVGFRAWLAVVAAVIVVSTVAVLSSRDVRRLERRQGELDAPAAPVRVEVPAG